MAKKSTKIMKFTVKISKISIYQGINCSTMLIMLKYLNKLIILQKIVIFHDVSTSLLIFSAKIAEKNDQNHEICSQNFGKSVFIVILIAVECL